MSKKIRRSSAEYYFSDNYERHVKPYISSSLDEHIRKAFDVDALRSMDKSELAELTRSLSVSANRRIGIYTSEKRNSYYMKTAEYYKSKGLVAMDSDVMPAPAAYANIIEREGSLKKFNVRNLENLSMGKLRNQLKSVREFLASESSLMGRVKTNEEGLVSDSSYGFYRIMAQREYNFKQAIASQSNVNIPSEEIMKSEEFSKLFWKTFNAVQKRIEGNRKEYYEKDKYGFMAKIMKEVTPFMQGKDVDIQELADNVERKLRGNYVESQKKPDKDSLAGNFSSGFRLDEND